MSIQSNFPAINPTLNLSFALTKALDPRISFARASTATYYGTQTAKAEENLLLQSQDYSTSWTVTSLTPVTGKTAPDATSTATEFTASAANAVLTQGYTAIAGSYTFSVFLRRVTGSGDIQIAADNGTWTTKVITGTWARYDVTQTVAAGSKTAGVRVVTDTDAIEVWGAQLEQRSAATAYTATTTQPITNYIPQLLTAASGVARFDHNPTTFESLGLEIEEQRTNLLTYSEQFDNAAWTKSQASITANTVVAPDGALTGDKIIASTVDSNHVCTQSISHTSGTSYTLTCFFKAAEITFASLTFASGFTGTQINGFYDLSAGSVGAVGAGGAATITPVGNGWYRCSLAITATATASSTVQIRLAASSTLAPFAGNDFDGAYIWGAQLEAGAFATSYIQTVASQVTRSADLASMTGTNFSSWYNQGEGTFYAQFRPAAADFGGNKNIFLASDGTTSNFVGLRYPSTGTQTALASTTSAVVQANVVTGTMVAGTSYKLAGAYRANDFAVSRNAGTVGTDTSGTIPVVTQAEIGMLAGAAFGTQTISKIAYYPLRVTNAQLQALTS
jgi:hypothetical protein